MEAESQTPAKLAMSRIKQILGLDELGEGHIRQVVADLSSLAQRTIEAGGNFPAWDKEMALRFGDTVRNFVRDGWEQAQAVVDARKARTKANGSRDPLGSGGPPGEAANTGSLEAPGSSRGLFNSEPSARVSKEPVESGPGTQTRGPEPKDPNYNGLKKRWLRADDEGRAQLEEEHAFLRQFAWAYRTYAKVHIHHLLPQKFREWFRSQGIDIDDHKYLHAMDEGEHLDIHGRGGVFKPHWNGEWQGFVDSFKKGE